MRVYISGPITKDKGYYRKFMNAEIKLKKAGHEVVNPARLGRLFPKSFDTTDYLACEYPIIERCDAVFFLKGWKESYGSRKEYEFALKQEIKLIFEKREDVIAVG